MSKHGDPKIQVLVVEAGDKLGGGFGADRKDADPIDSLRPVIVDAKRRGDDRPDQQKKTRPAGKVGDDDSRIAAVTA